MSTPSPRPKQFRRRLHTPSAGTPAAAAPRPKLPSKRTALVRHSAVPPTPLRRRTPLAVSPLGTPLAPSPLGTPLAASPLGTPLAASPLGTPPPLLLGEPASPLSQRLPVRRRLFADSPPAPLHARVKPKRCLNAEDVFTLEEWSELDPADIVQIYFPSATRPRCYSRSNLLRFFAEPDATAANWVQDPREPPMDKEGYGGMAGARRFYRLPEGLWIDEGSVDLLTGAPRVFDAAVVRPNQRLGNVESQFLVSGHHGQLPGFPIYRLTAR